MIVRNSTPKLVKTEGCFPRRDFAVDKTRIRPNRFLKPVRSVIERLLFSIRLCIKKTQMQGSGSSLQASAPLIKITC